MPRPRYRPPDLGFFAEVTERSAYWLGFLIADGCVTDREVILVLQRRDEAHVRRFLAAICCDDRPLASANAGNGVRAAIGSVALTRQLAARGLAAGRGARDEGVSEELATSRHFWRGVTDGDGCLKLGRDGMPYLEVAGPPRLMTQLADFLAARLPDGHRPRPALHSGSGAIRIVRVGGRHAKATAALLYGGAPADVLTRKAERAARILAWEPTVFARYPWERWGDGTTWRLERGTDYVAARRLWEAGRRAARERGARLIFEDRGAFVLLRFAPRAESRAA